MDVPKQKGPAASGEALVIACLNFSLSAQLDQPAAAAAVVMMVMVVRGAEHSQEPSRVGEW
jgi:hypothetical protein